MEHIPEQWGLKSPKTARELLDMYFLDIRSALLETAAALDRIERAQASGEELRDPRLDKLFEACDIIRQEKRNRAERFLTLFSDPL